MLAAFRQKFHERRVGLSPTAIDLGGSVEFVGGLRAIAPS